MPTVLRLITTLALTTAMAAAGASSAVACGVQRLSQPLAALGDQGWYLPVDNAGFEAKGSDWRPRNAVAVLGNEPWKVRGASDRYAMRLAQGGTIQSDQVCVTLDHTHARFFAKAASPSAVLKVEALWDNNGRDHVATVLTLAGRQFGAWGLSPIVPIASVVASLYEDEADELIALRFTAVSGSWDVDDVLVDPYRTR